MGFDEFVRTRLPDLLRFATVMCGSAEQAHDVVQEALIKAHAAWDRVDSATSPEAYMRRIVVNEFLSWRRKWVRMVPHAQVPTIGHVADPATAFADRMLLIAGLRRLPRRQRAVLALRYYGGLTDSEIAVELSCTASTVRAYAARGLAALRVDTTLTTTATPIIERA